MFVFISLAQKNVTRKKERSALTIIGVLLAVAATISLVSIAEGLYERLNYEINLQDVDIYVLPKSSSFLPAGSMGAIGSGSLIVSREYINQIKSIAGVKDVTGITRLLATAGKEKVGVVVWGIIPDKMNIFFPKIEIQEGDFFQKTNDLIIGPQISRELKIDIENQFPISQVNFNIVGKTYPVYSFEDYACFISLDDALTVQRTQGVQEIWVQVADDSSSGEIDNIIKTIRKEMKDVTVKTKVEYLGDANHFVALVRLLQYAISAIGILIAITASMNTMLMSTYERMDEFGTLRAIGASRFFIFSMVLFESLFLSFIGGILGVLLGFLGSGLFNDAIVTLLKLSFPVSKVTFRLIIEALMLSIGVGLLGALIPAFIASRMEIIKALRWE
ncbi:MAG TPA: ABC transporter permease [Candidatus Eremiobacteraeota bacterium]|nr:MAG: ABC transporter permease YtrF precursor [bacterium ADurb.Bin363]HPZ09950.1 ABC transporter permease [Candidatus Eremiobacteraeota bacterium]